MQRKRNGLIMSSTITRHSMLHNSRQQSNCNHKTTCYKNSNSAKNTRTCTSRMQGATESNYANTSRLLLPHYSPSILCIVLIWICTLLSHTVNGFNLDTASPVRYYGPRGSYFGYSVLLHENNQGNWVLAGAPRDNSIFQPTLQKPGALYKCPYNPAFTSRGSCSQVKVDDKGNEMSAPTERPYVLDAKDNQWLGVSLARQNIGRNGKVTVCGHLWANDFYKDAILPNGVCYTADASLGFNTVTKQRPCLHEVQIKADKAGRGIAWHGWCQAGFSAKYTDDGSSLILGAVGSLAWRGSIVSITDIDGSARVSDVTSWFPPEEEDESYIGYAVSSGHFLDTISIEGVTGAPRAYERGKVYIYDLTDFTLLAQLDGESMNTYFGAAVLGIDMNHDGLSDLLVGAPLYSQTQDEGRVYIFINQGQGVLRRNDVMLSGSNQQGARFGSTIENAGDLNRDRYMDVVVGAPYEDEMSGAVYIYHGSPYGLQTHHVQRLAGKLVAPNLKSFGSALSGSVDVDGNGYTDLLVGAYESDTAILFKTKPIVNIKAFMAITRSPIDLNRTECTHFNKKVPCVRAMICFMYTDTEPSTIAIDFTLDTEYYKMQANLIPRLQFVEKGQYLGTKIVRNTVLQSKLQQCFEIQAHIYRDLKDYLSPVPFRLHYDLRTSDNTQFPPVTTCAGLCPVLNYYSANNIVEQVRFIHNCGNDSVCETDLKLRSDVLLPRGTSYLPLGTDEFLYVAVDLWNYGEEAHMTQVEITFPREITYVRVENTGQQDQTLVLCYPAEPQNRTASVVCDVDNPMRANAISRFKVRLSIEAIGRKSPNLEISVHASTTSFEHNRTLADNFVFISLPVKIEADVTVSGVTHPEQVFYGASRTLDKDSSIEGIEKGMDGDLGMLPTMTPREREKSNEEILDEKIGPKFRHIYDARNLGPSELPFPVIVNISMPYKTHDDQWLLYFTNILFQGTGRCEYYHIIREQHDALGGYLSNRSALHTPSKEHSRVSSMFGSKPKTLTCAVMKCVTITCYVDNLAVGEGAVIEIQARLFEKTFVDNEFGIVAVVSEAKIAVEDPFNEHIQPANGRPDLIKVATLAYTDQATNIWRTPKWLLVLSIVIGIVLLVIVVAVMWKCGFFRRPMREEMERLINEKDETENLYPEGIWDHPYDDPPDHFQSS
ncbi:integrin alpha-9-like isoform X2 [Amphiura filiformis]|uniref:integrin alpha-9-like isoform X2 n=1 Tax=Amphiura filiformis TaxID=82378 RepID=UPI003B21168C